MQNYIELALSASDSLLTVPEFIITVEYDIDSFMIDRFWNTMENDQLIYVDDELICWMGYEGDTRYRKHSFMKILSSMKESVDYHYYSNEEYEKFYSKSVCPIGHTEIYPKVDRSNGKNMTKHLLLTPKCFKITMMKINTNRGNQARNSILARRIIQNLYKISNGIS